MVSRSMVISGGVGMGSSSRSSRRVAPMSRVTHAEASAALAELDPVIAGLVERHGPMRLPRPAPAARRFEELAESIAYQQLAGRAAATIWGRFRSRYGSG